jgi:hypothetical protein
VVADEPVSALDVSVQAAVTQLLMEIQRENNTTLIFISHDLSLVRYLADKVMVMYLGQIMEQGRTIRSSSRPTTPIPRRCSRRCPIADTNIEKKRIVLEGDIPSPAIEPAAGLPLPDPLPLEEQPERQTQKAVDNRLHEPRDRAFRPARRMGHQLGRLVDQRLGRVPAEFGHAMDDDGPPDPDHRRRAYAMVRSRHEAGHHPHDPSPHRPRQPQPPGAGHPQAEVVGLHDQRHAAIDQPP